MKFSRLALAVTVCSVIGIGAASAADLAARPYTKAPAIAPVAIYDWSGFYIGGNGGWGSSRKCFEDQVDSTGRRTLGSEGCHDATGGVAGGQVGYRWQSSAWVFGVEAQYDWADLRGSNISNQFCVAGLFCTTENTKIKSLGMFTGQVGYAVNNWLLYAKGGAAVTQDNYFSTLTFAGAPFRGGGASDTGSETRWGGVVGAGVEFGFAPRWSVAVEYDHMFMGTHGVNFYNTNLIGNPFLTGTFSRNVNIRQDVDLVTVRLNYTFGGGAVVAKY
jgi:outer membrane immunogenic protein